ncbi:hypothetical protein RB195_020948 [Necator americanus]|uniref:WD domain, G-beta repeat protein n=1 Tax=Necator americanus TaxID=51031 RepID=A0ABR1CLD7_NECAM
MVGSKRRETPTFAYAAALGSGVVETVGIVVGPWRTVARCSENTEKLVNVHIDVGRDNGSCTSFDSSVRVWEKETKLLYSLFSFYWQHSNSVHMVESDPGLSGFLLHVSWTLPVVERAHPRLGRPVVGIRDQAAR